MNFEFMTIDTPLPLCMPFPRALTGFPVSSTAKVMYCRMLDAMLTISFTLHDNGLLLSVSDDGNGFDKDSLQKAANPYFTGESNHSEHFGLGLYICKLLCEHHNGYLQIRNTVNGANVSAYFKSPTL